MRRFSCSSASASDSRPRSGIPSSRLARTARPRILSRLLVYPLRILFPHGSRDADTLSALAENAGANLLGLGNAATPAGIRAACGLMRLHAQTELNTLVVLNTASIQLVPAAAATLRASFGSVTPFDIMPAVWLTSIFSLSVGLAVNRLLNGGAA